MRWATAGMALLLASASHAADDAKIIRLATDTAHDLRLSTFCIAGHLFVVAVSDVGQGGGMAMQQVQHVADGKIVPMTCKGEPPGTHR